MFSFTETPTKVFAFYIWSDIRLKFMKFNPFQKIQQIWHPFLVIIAAST